MEAKMARKIANQNKDSAYRKLADDVDRLITEAARNGHYKRLIPIECDDYAAKWLKTRLEKDGYSVEVEPDCKTADPLAYCIAVSWEEGDEETTDDQAQPDILVKRKRIVETCDEVPMAVLKKIEERQRDCQDKLAVISKNLYDLHLMVKQINARCW